jgi:hypothetical protein
MNSVRRPAGVETAVAEDAFLSGGADPPQAGVKGWALSEPFALCTVTSRGLVVALSRNCSSGKGRGGDLFVEPAHEAGRPGCRSAR